MDDCYLAFIDYIGSGIEGGYTYRFDFTDNTDTVWGNYFNIAPTIIIPDLQPEENTIIKTAKVVFDRKINLAKKNGCFSMQDCFDGIIALAFTELSEENTIYYNDEPLYFSFGESYNEVESKLISCGYKFFDVIDKKIGDESIIEELIETINNDDVTESDDLTLIDNTYEEVITIEENNEVKRDSLNELLFNSGYKRVEYIKKEGEYTFRGHIVDIYSYNHAYPIRISFFGDTVEKITKFDESSQKEIERINEITIYKIKE